jgi:hypothetical protein
VRVRQHLLTPGMEHSQKAEVRSEPARVTGNREQGLRDTAKQDGVHPLRVLEHQWRETAGKGEHDMAVGNGQKFLRRSCQPLVPRRGLAFWTVPIPAGYGELTITCLMGSVF